jgi:hypothetical protein
MLCRRTSLCESGALRHADFHRASHGSKLSQIRKLNSSRFFPTGSAQPCAGWNDRSLHQQQQINEAIAKAQSYFISGDDLNPGFELPLTA